MTVGCLWWLFLALVWDVFYTYFLLPSSDPTALSFLLHTLWSILYLPFLLFARPSFVFVQRLVTCQLIPPPRIACFVQLTQ